MTIKNVQIVNYDNIIECADIEFKNGVITKITKNYNDFKYKIIPGFIDTHVHGFMNYDCMEGTHATEMMSKNLAKNGVTTFLPTAMTQDWKIILKALNNIAKAKSIGARIAGIHIEGPFIGEAQKGAHKTEFLRQATPDLINQLSNASNNKLRKISYDPLMTGLDSVKQMLDNNIIPSIGHTACDYNLANQHLANGALCICHLWNAMSGVHHRNPGLAQASLMDKDVMAELIIDLFHVSPQTIKFSIANKGIDKIMAISDAIKPAYYQDGDSVSGGIPISKKGKQIFLKGTNTIAGSAITIYDAFQNLLELGYDIKHAVRMTSYNAARNTNLEQVGYLDAGYYADFVMLDQNNQLVKVFVNGKEQ